MSRRVLELSKYLGKVEFNFLGGGYLWCEDEDGRRIWEDSIIGDIGEIDLGWGLIEDRLGNKYYIRVFYEIDGHLIIREPQPVKPYKRQFYHFNSTEAFSATRLKKKYEGEKGKLELNMYEIDEKCYYILSRGTMYATTRDRIANDDLIYDCYETTHFK
ncbi:MAG: hypothetical protein LUF31_03675 [Fusobacterium sp.]|nr:hypothetical protein [Fusobacterium sp.]